MLDLSAWLTKAEAAERLGVSERTLDRLGDRGPEKRMRARSGKKPEPVYNPDDVDAIAAAANAPRVMPNGPPLAPAVTMTPAEAFDRVMQIVEAVTRVAERRQALAIEAPAAAQEPVEAWPHPEKAYLTVQEARLVSGCSEALIRRLCREGRLGFRDGRTWRIARGDIANIASLVGIGEKAARIGGARR